MKSFRLSALGRCLLVLMALGMVSCDKYNYTDPLQKLGKRVEILEQMVLEANTEVNAMHEIVVAIEQNGYVTNVVQNDDGTYTITFNTGKTFTLRNGRVGKDGKDGKSITLNVGVKQHSDGKWYWTLNGEWLLDGDGNMMPAGATDGKDGTTKKVVMPQVRINSVNHHWEISTDGGKTWEDSGVYADGADGKNGIDGADGADGIDGKDGKDGKDAADDMFLNIIESEDGKSITFVMRDGRTFIVPIMSD